MFVITGRSARSAAMPYCFYSEVQKWVFRPAGTTHCQSAPRATFHVYRGKNVGIQPPILSKFVILLTNLPLMGDAFAQVLRNSRLLYASTGSFSLFTLVAFGGQITKL